MREVKVDHPSPLHNQVFGAGDGVYLRFFEQRVKSFSMGDCAGSKGAIACVISSKDPTKVWLTEKYLTYNAEPIQRVAILLHESRHTEGFHHVVCPDSFDDGLGHGIESFVGDREFAGDPACDDKMLGAYGIEIIFLRNIARSCTTCAQSSRDTADVEAIDGYRRIIDSAARKALFADLFQ